MKIGSFAQQNHVGIDTIRHYISLELLFPKRQGVQFEFDERCQSDFNAVIGLKRLGFSLSEIKKIILIRRLGEMTKFQQDDYYLEIFRGRLKSIEAETKKLSQFKSLLREEIRGLSSAKDDHALKMGVDLSWLSRLKCPACGGRLILSEATVTDDMVMCGRLHCGCGNEYAIADGILCIDAEAAGKKPPPGIMAYIRNTDSEYLNQLYKTLEWKTANIGFSDFENRVILDLGSGVGFFLRSIYKDLPASSLYIAVDNDGSALRSLKRILERADIRKNILFVCCDFSHIPLPDESVDILCDMAGTSNYCFDHEDFLLKTLNPLLKKDSMLISSFLTFRNFSENSLIRPACRRNFREDTVREQLLQLSFIPEAENVSAVITKGGIYESYFRPGEKVTIYSFIGKRSG